MPEIANRTPSGSVAAAAIRQARRTTTSSRVERIRWAVLCIAKCQVVDITIQATIVPPSENGFHAATGSRVMGWNHRAPDSSNPGAGGGVASGTRPPRRSAIVTTTADTPMTMTTS